MTSWRRGVFAWMVMVCLWMGRDASAQTPTNTAVVKGSVVDATGAQVGGARVHAESVGPTRRMAESGVGDTSQGGLQRDTTADGTGHFLLTLPGGTYLLTVQSPGFDPYVRENLKLSPGQHIDLPVKLLVTASEVVNVPSDASASTDPADNKSAITFSGGQLDILSDDDTILQQQLTAIAGGDPSLPPQILIDGFSNGQFPPKSSIREIRINQNPYSAQYDQPGFGRVEVFTKPGSDTFHGFLNLFGNDHLFNARNPFIATAEPPYHRLHFFADVSGPLGKKMSFDLGGNVNDDDSNTPIDATVLTASLAPLSIAGVVASPTFSQTYTARLDRQVGANDTATLRYSVSHTHSSNSGISILTLGSEATDALNTTQTLQAGDTHVIGAKVVVESRFQYNRSESRNDPVSTAPTLIVQGSFNGGGAPGQAVHDHTDRFEFQEYVSLALKSHFIRTGGRYRLTRDANLATGGFNGQYIFPDLGTYQRALADVANGLSGAAIAAKGDGPSQFNLTAGQPAARVMTGDAGLYAEDDWKARPDLTVSYGGRLETQSAIPDHLDLAPRVGAAWAPLFGKSKTPPFTVRAGFGFFYDRFDSGNLLQTIRQNGVTEQGYFVENPTFFGCAGAGADGSQCVPTIPSVASLSAVQPSIYRLSPHLHAEYQMQGGLTVDHSFGERGSASVGWIRGRGVHQFELLNVNAPLPGTYDPANPASGTRPLGGTQNIYQYSSDGIRNLDQFRMNVNFQPTRNTYLFGFYQLGAPHGDTTGAGNLPSDQYNIRQDYGLLPGNALQRLYLGGGGDLGYGFSTSIFLAARSASPFNITTGTDLNGDTAYNDRPSYATDLTRPSVVRTAYGNFDTAPIAGQTLVPFDSGPGATLFYSEIELNRSFFFGTPRADAVKSAAEAKVKPGERRPKPEPPYRLVLQLEADNVINHVNAGPPVGVLSSPYFGRSISLSSAFGSNGAANRLIYLGAGFHF